MMQIYNIIQLSFSNYMANQVSSKPGVHCAIILFFAYQLAYNVGYKVDFPLAIALQLISYFVNSQSKLECNKTFSRKTLLCFVPFTKLDTPIETSFITNLALGGSLLSLLTLYEVYQRKEFILSCIRDLYNTFAPSFDVSSVWSRINFCTRPATFESLYTVDAKLGEGAFSTVHKAICKRSKESYAVKIIKKSKLLEEEETRLQQEIELMKELKECDEILSIQSVFEDSKNFLLVTDIMKGGDLLERLADVSSFSEQQARHLIKSIHKAVGYMHSKGIAHRDIKLENILLTSTKKDCLDVKLSDFGFAKKVTAPNSLTTMCGSPAYVAPEILQNLAYGVEVDIWSLGVVAYNLLSGYQPFRGENEMDVKEAIKTCNFQFENEYWNKITDDAKSFIKSLLQIDPKKRPTANDAVTHTWFSKNINQIGEEKNEDVEDTSKVFFMIGSQRSGSNWLRTMLGEREDLAGPHPPHIMRDMLPIIEKFGNLSDDENYLVLADHVCTFVENNQVPWTDNNGNKVHFNRRQIFNKAKSSCERLLRKRIEDNGPLKPSLYLLAIFDAIMFAFAKANKKSLWICKSMGMSAFHRELIEFYGESRLRYIYLVRDPRDVAMSFMKTPVGDCHYHSIVSKWTKLQHKALHIMETNPDIVHKIHYESILANKTETVKGVYKFIGERRFGGVQKQASVLFMTPDEDLIGGAKNGTEAQIANKLSTQFRNLGRGNSFAINQLAKWRHPTTGLEDENILIIESVSHEVMQGLGYETHLVGKSRKPLQFSKQDLLDIAELNRKAIESMNASLRKENPEDLARRIKQAKVLTLPPNLLSNCDEEIEEDDESSVDAEKLKSKPLIESKRTFKLNGRGMINCAMATHRGFYPDKLDKPNQDSAFLKPILEDEVMMFSVYDGHGPDGHKCSQYARKNVPELFEKALATTGDMKSALDIAHVQAHKDMLKDSSIDDKFSGTTASTVLLHDNKLIVSNVGDSACMLGRRGNNPDTALCTEHTPMRQDELQRIKDSGGVVMTLAQHDGKAPMHEKWDGKKEIPRVWSNDKEKYPGCGFTRSLGDSVAHNFGVSERPEFFEHTFGSDDQILIVASDGITEFMDIPTCINFVRHFSDPAEAAAALVKKARDRWIAENDYIDDITAIVIFLDVNNKDEKKDHDSLKWREQLNLKDSAIKELTNMKANVSLYIQNARCIASGIFSDLAEVSSMSDLNSLFPFISEFTNAIETTQHFWNTMAEFSRQEMRVIVR